MTPSVRQVPGATSCAALVVAALFVGPLAAAQGQNQSGLRTGEQRPPVREALTGIVQSADGQPIAGAAVVIASCSPRSTPSLVSKHCHPDCLKHTFTDRAGRYTIEDVVADHKFDLVFAADGYGHKLANGVESGDEPEKVFLGPSSLPTIADPNNDVPGEVVDPEGKPVPGRW